MNYSCFINVAVAVVFRAKSIVSLVCSSVPLNVSSHLCEIFQELQHDPSVKGLRG